MSKIPMSISWFDIEHVLRQADMKMSDLCDEQIEEILFFCGVERGTYEIEEVLHRPRFSVNNEPWSGKRFSGYERQDKEWLFSGKSSIENVIASQTDMHHKRDLMMMSMSSTNTYDACTHLESEAKRVEKKRNT